MRLTIRCFYIIVYSKNIFLVVYVYDIIITSNDHDEISQLKQHFIQSFLDQGSRKIEIFFRIEVAH